MANFLAKRLLAAVWLFFTNSRRLIIHIIFWEEGVHTNHVHDRCTALPSAKHFGRTMQSFSRAKHGHVQSSEFGRDEPREKDMTQEVPLALTPG